MRWNVTDLTFWAQQRANWERPGALVRDPETGAAFRLGVQWEPNNNETVNLRFQMRDGNFVRAKLRAIAAGPVVDDPGTRGILLDWLVRVWCKDGADRSVALCADAHGYCVDLHDNGNIHGLASVESAIHWALTSPDSNVREDE